MMNEVDAIYQKELGVTFNLDFVGLDGDKNVLGDISRNTGNALKELNDDVMKVIDTDDFCVVIVMTSIDFVGNAVGSGFIGTVCQSHANVAVITDQAQRGRPIGSREVLSIVTHELGHVFGSQHDADGNNCGNEPEDQRFVMFPSVQSSSVNGFGFSECSKQQIRQNINNIKEPDRVFFESKLPCHSNYFRGPNGNGIAQTGFGSRPATIAGQMVIDY
jgi:hypothetical protein